MDKRLEAFLNLSAAMTGFDRQQLIGKGVGPQYLDTLEAIVPAVIVDRLLESSAVEPAETTTGEILDDAALGPVARNIIVLWYSGAWTPLPEAWCNTHGRSARDVGHVISSAAYLNSLQWVAAGAHPAGGLPPGFASWALPPLEFKA